MDFLFAYPLMSNALFVLVSERRYFGELMNMLDVHVQEMKSMSNAIRKLEGTKKFLYDQNGRYDQCPDHEDHYHGCCK